MSTKDQYATLRPHLNELQWRIYLGTEAEKIGRGGISIVSRNSGAARQTIRKGIVDSFNAPADRIRKTGGGRRRIAEKDAGLVADLESMIEPKGDPMSLVRWTAKSVVRLAADLAKRGHAIKKSALYNLMANTLNYSLKANKKNIEGVSHPDRDVQFRHIKASCEAFEKKKSPMISVDCKKKELIGNFKNNGREWRPEGQNTVVHVYDFESIGDGKDAPYGVYDNLKNAGFVNVGVDHDTASFAIESIRRWWNGVGKKLYRKKKKLLLTSAI